MEEARQMMAELRSTDDESHALVRMSSLRLRLGDVAGARRDIETAQRIGVQTGSPISNTAGLLGRAALEHHEGRTGEARRLAGEALAMIDRIPFTPPQIKGNIHCLLATYAVSAGDLDEAQPHLRLAYDAVKESRDMPIGAVLAVVFADFVHARGRSVEAAVLLGTAFALRGVDDLGDPDVRGVGAALRAVLGPQEFTRHYTAGRNLTRAEAMARLEANLPAASSSPAEEDHDEPVDVG